MTCQVCLILHGSACPGIPSKRSPPRRSAASSSKELVLNGAEHSALGDRTVGVKNRNPNHHCAILAVSNAFWDACAWLRKDTAAKDWLEGADPRSTLEVEDRWQRK